MSLPRPRWANAEIAVWCGAGEDDLALAGGYLRVAGTAARHWIAHGPDDRLPLPIPYDYRHSLELSLKWLIRKAAQCALREGHAGEEDLGPDQSDKRLRTHDVRRLADCLDRYLALLDLPKVEQRIDPESWSQLNWLDSEDATGETYRYAVVGHGAGRAPARPVQQNVDFYEQDPPGAASASRITKSRRWRRRWWPAASPAWPPPTTTTSVCWVTGPWSPRRRTSFARRARCGPGRSAPALR